MAKPKISKCGDCGTKIIIMDSPTGSLLPVELKGAENVQSNDIFDHNIHNSHLLNCSKMQLRWDKVKNQMLRRRAVLEKLDTKDMLK